MGKSQTSTYILTLKLNTNDRDKAILNKRFEICRKLYNAILGVGLKKFRTLSERKIYRKLRKELSEINKQYHNFKDIKKQKLINKSRKDKYKELNELLNEFGINEYSLINEMTPLYKPFNKNIDNKTAQALASRAWKSLDKLIFGNANKISFKKYDELESIEGKWNASGITYRDGFIKWNKLKIPVIIKNNDTYAQMTIQDRVKYCRIKREMIKCKYYYYVQLVMEGKPPKKTNKETGEIKCSCGSGNVGIDIGTQTIAYSSKNQVRLLELAPKVNKIDREVKLLQKKMDKSRRATNPNKFNENGTIKKGNKDKWIYSNHYILIKNKRKELFRKQRAIRKQCHYKLINEILPLGNKFYVETMNYQGLQKRAKDTTVNEKTGRINKKKRFGKSLANKAPSMFLTMLDNKLKWNDTQLFKIDTYRIKASQYNHFTDEYNKKNLNDRWNIFNISNEEIKIQRDLYSAFLIMNVKDNLKEIDRELCFNEFSNFKILHDKEINRIRNSDSKLISSMGI